MTSTSRSRKPSKPWRVYGAGGISTDYRGQSAAYDAVRSIVATGVTANVYHWENGQWRWYDEIKPGEA